jgi:threonine/homoserine/homoserine lactone efflux protein
VTPENFIGLGLVLVLGAISPGPSLALVLRNTMNGGRRHGVLTGIGHGLGFGIYAFLSAAGLAVALNAHPYTVAALRWGGTVILIWLGWTFLQHASQGPPLQNPTHTPPRKPRHIRWFGMSRRRGTRGALKVPGRYSSALDRARALYDLE